VLSSLKVNLVTNNAGILIRINESAQSMGVSAVSENVERGPAFSIIVRLSDIFLLKEQCEVVPAQSENVLTRQNLELLVFTQ
jgi:hypothetical protein